MARLPQPGSDSGKWGDILNDYLSQSHKNDGTLKDNSVTAATIADGTIQEAQLSSAVSTKLNAPANITDGSITKIKLESSVQTSLGKADSAYQKPTGGVPLSDIKQTDLDARYDLNGVAAFKASDNVIYVSKGGSDGNTGRAAGSPKLTIAAALSVLGSSAGQIRLGSGTWTESVSLGAGQSIRGTGPKATYINVTSSAVGVTLTGASCGVFDMGFTGDSTGTGINANSAVFATIDNIYYKYCATGISFTSSSYSHASKINSDVNLTVGVSFYKAVNCTLRDSTISGAIPLNVSDTSLTDANALGVLIDSGCDGVELGSVNIQAKVGLRISHSDTSTHVPYSTILTSVQVGGGASDGFIFDSGTGTQVTSCGSFTQTGFGFRHNTELGVTYSNCRALNSGSSGFLAAKGSFTWTGGQIAGNGASSPGTTEGVHISAGVSNWSIVGARIGETSGSGYQNTQRYGIGIVSGASDNYLVGSIIWGQSTVGDFADSARGKNGFISGRSVATAVRHRAGGYYATADSGAAPAAGAAGTEAQARATPFRVDSIMTLDEVGLEVTTAGTSGAVFRLGIYKDAGSTPGSLVVDAGTIDATVAGYAGLSVSVSLTPGLYWLVACAQGAATTPGAARCHVGAVRPVVHTAALSVSQSALNAVTQSSVTGALPATFSASSVTGVGYRVLVRIAA